MKWLTGWANVKEGVRVSRMNLAPLIVVLAAFLFPFEALGEKIRVGVLLPLTGNYATLGKDCQAGIDVAQSLFAPNVRDKIEFISADSQAEPRVAVSEFRKLVEFNQVQAVILNRSPIGMAVNPLSKQMKIPILGMVGHPDFTPQNEYAVMYWLNSNDEGGALARYALSRGIKTAAIITSEDEWTVTLSKAFASAFRSGGGTITFDETIPPQESDMQTVALKMKAKRPGLAYLSLSIGQIGPMLRRLDEKSISLERYSNFWLGKKDVISSAGLDAAEGALYAELAWNRPKFKAALKGFLPTEEGSSMNYTCYAGAAAIGQVAFEKNFKEALRNLPSVTLQDETLQIKNREVQYPIALRIIKDGKPVLGEELPPF